MNLDKYFERTNIKFKLSDHISEEKYVKNVDENIDVVNSSAKQKNYKTVELVEDVDLEFSSKEVQKETTQNLFDGYLGEQREVPNPLEYGPNATYRNLREGVVYKKGPDNLWETFVKDGQNGRNGQSAPGGGCGVSEVKSIIVEKVGDTIIGDNGDVSLLNPINFGVKSTGVGTYVRHPTLVNLTTSADVTWGVRVELPARNVRAVRIAVVPSSTGATQYIGIMGSTAALSSNWTYSTTTRTKWNDSLSADIPQSATPTKIWSDWGLINPITRTDSTTAGTILQIRLYSLSANIKGSGGFGSEVGWTTKPLKYITGYMSGNHVADASVFNTISADFCPVVAIEYTTDDDIATVLEVGDSLCMGEKNNVRGYGMLHMACDTMNSKSPGERKTRITPIELGVAGRNSKIYYKDFTNAVEGEYTKPAIAIFRPYTRNNGYSVTHSGLGNVFVNECRNRNIIPILVTGIYESNTSGYNQCMRDTNAAVREIARKYSVDLIDLEPLITAENASTYLDVDGIHTNNAGTVLLSTEYEKVLERVASRYSKP